MPHASSDTPAPETGPTGTALCALCAARGTSCCETDPALGHLSFPLSAPEWRRLSAYAPLAVSADPGQGEFTRQQKEADARAALLGEEGAATLPERSGEPPAQGDDLCQSWPNNPDFIASMHALFPGEKKRIHEMFSPGGSHLSLRLRPDGACVFLGAKGCRLPRAARPWYCRLFPAWFMHDSPTLFMAEGCLVYEKARGPLHGIGLLEQNVTGARRLHDALRRDWGLDS